MFQASLFKMSFTKIILIYFFVISILSTQTLIQSQIDLRFHCFYLKINWKIHGILCHKRSGNPASVLTHFKIFITKICIKVPGIWHKKPWKQATAWELCCFLFWQYWRNTFMGIILFLNKSNASLYAWLIASIRDIIQIKGSEGASISDIIQISRSEGVWGT